MNENYCRRTKSISVPPKIKKILSKAFINSNASKLPNGSFRELYADKSSLLEEMRSTTNQIIWGRRGTGKTHLLNAFVETVNGDDSSSDIALYVSCDRMAKETPREAITFPSEYDRIRFFANETFKNFIDTLCEQLFEQYEDFLQYKKDAVKTELPYDEFLERVGNKILELMEINTKGVPHSEIVTEEHSLTDTDENNSERGMKLASNIQNSGIFGRVQGILSRRKKSNTKQVLQQKKVIRYEQYLPAIQRCLSDLLEEMNITCLYVCIDELWLVDEKSSNSFQPYFLDNIRLTLGVQPKLGIKIASIRETTDLNNKTDIRITYGMQSGNDITELAYLDPIQSKMTLEYEMFKNLLTRRIHYYLNTLPDSTEQDHAFDEDYIVEMLFKDERNFKILVDMSHGIPRNFINMLNTCLRKLDYNLSSFYIHYYLISEVVIDTYKNEHRSDLSLVEENNLFRAIDKYARYQKQYFFLIKNKAAERLKQEVNTLLYKEIIHRIPSAETPSTIMNDYKAFYLDLGMYFLSIRETSFEQYEQTIKNFHLLFPDDLKSNYRKYVLDLRDVSSDYCICPQCNSFFLKTHPVYAAYSICPDCAFQIHATSEQ